MTGPQQGTLEVDLLATAQAMTCPRCGTSNARCRVWAGGPGHTSGMHDARITLAQHALTRQLVDLVTDPALAGEITAPASGTAHGHPGLPVPHHQEVSAA